ncbi:PTS transporter subunit EIIB [Demequina zhanjiangensis]|uniref:PTS transporter subunit EIIB n=1 Tax=Demequina zhanjiangensis TaxID=3051659 RepID=A0ABT8G213_9MICO|nr:PTS transporter subunit EIIB [Demequina sp. SYSU T00b26]MDN4472744.1 PTS transporter subunit EIIB [Demequina sp. SYSU T00b26]
MAVESTALASSIIALAGGVDNISGVERCMVRLRLILADPDVADVPAIASLPGVALAMHLMGQLQIAPTAHLDDLHATVVDAVAAARP